MRRLEVYKKLIIDIINQAIEEMDIKDCVKNWNDFLIYSGYEDSKSFKEDVLYVAMQYDNDLYRNGIENENEMLNVYDDGSITDNDNKDYSYRQIMSMIRKELFKDSCED